MNRLEPCDRSVRCTRGTTKTRNRSPQRRGYVDLQVMRDACLVDRTSTLTFTLADIERAFRSSWGPDTTCLDDDGLERWDRANPAYGQCGPTALIIQELLGGDLLIASVTGGQERDGWHYWNRLGRGIELDLTREQFTAGQIIGTPKVVIRPPEGPRRFIEECQRLRFRVLTTLGVGTASQPSGDVAKSIDRTHQG